MKAIFIATLAAALGISIAAHAQDSAQSAPRCLELGFINGWQNTNGNTSLIIENNSNHKFRIDLMGPCMGLEFTQTLALRSPGGMALSCVSTGDTIAFPQAGMMQKCFIQKVTPLPDTTTLDHKTTQAPPAQTPPAQTPPAQ